MNASRNLLWEHETPFQIYAEGAAQSVFRLLDDKLKPRLFFIGFAVTDSKLPLRYCGVVPEECDSFAEGLSSLKLRVNDIRVMLRPGTDLLSWLYTRCRPKWRGLFALCPFRSRNSLTTTHKASIGFPVVRFQCKWAPTSSVPYYRWTGPSTPPTPG